MRVIESHDQLNGFTAKTINVCNEGRWFHAYRVCILKIEDSPTKIIDDRYTAVSLNIFERIAAFFYRLFNQNYFFPLTCNNVKLLNSPFLDDRTIDERFAEFERKKQEKDAKDAEEVLQIINDIFAIETLYSDLEAPQDIEMKEILEGASFAQEYIQNNASGDSMELKKESFSNHPHLSHFDTLIAVLRRLVFSNTITGFVVDKDNSVIQIALNNQSELLINSSFIDKKTLIDTLVKPFLKSLKEAESAEVKAT